MIFIDKLVQQIQKKRSPSVIGLDPNINLFPSKLRKGSVSENIFSFNKRIIDATYDLIPAVKPQSAYYERYGAEGLKALSATCNYAKDRGLIVIVDAKRNDIGSTATAYADTFLNSDNRYGFDVDAITVNAYLGCDGIIPFIDACKKYNKGIFVLVKTSNPSSGEIQNLMVGSRPLYDIVAAKVDGWGEALIGNCGYSSVGAVVGATYPQEIRLLRETMPKSFFLIPGYGAQGGTAEDVKDAFRSDGLGALINASRSVLYAFKSTVWRDRFSEEEFDLAARAEVEDMNKRLNQVIGKWT